MLTHEVTGGEFQNLDEADIQGVLTSHTAELIEGHLEWLTAFVGLPDDLADQLDPIMQRCLK
jgi:hypothetical protein